MNLITENFDNVITWLTIITVLIAAYTDLRWRKIFNKLTFPAAIIGLLLHSVDSGWEGFLFSSLGLAIGIVIFIVPFVFGKMGAGDVKLMGAIGALVGGYAVLNIALLTTIFGGAIAVFIALYSDELRETFYKTLRLIKNIFGKSKKEFTEVNASKSIKMPYGLAIGGGTICFLIIGRII